MSSPTFTYSDTKLSLLMEEPMSGRIRCDTCGKFVGHHTVKVLKEIGEYGVVEGAEFFCPKCYRT